MAWCLVEHRDFTFTYFILQQAPFFFLEKFSKLVVTLERFQLKLNSFQQLLGVRPQYQM